MIALVCSAGGLQALRAVLAPLPGDLGAAVVVLQHASPDHPNRLAEILDRHCSLPVRDAVAGDHLAPGQVLVAPAGKHTLISASETITLIPSGERPPYRPSGDLLLTTLALAVGRRAVAVVLTGGGNDAATGATAIHHLGGTVIVCSQETSTYPAMPHATINRDTITDHVVSLHDIAALLMRITITLPA